MTSHLSSHHRLTIDRIFNHPAGGNVEWRRTLSLLENLGTATEEHNGKYAVTLGPETETFEAPRGKDIDEQMAVDLRRMLKQAGLAPSGEAPVLDAHRRDNGDGRWRAPS
jgi:hypothetical protein